MYLLPLVGIYVACRKIYFFPASFCLQNLKRYIIAIRSSFPDCCFALFSASVACPCWPFLPPGRAVRALITLSAITCQPCRFAVLACPLAYLHVTRHAHQFAFVVFCQCVGLSAKRRTDDRIVAVPSSAWLHGRGPPCSP